jgi:phosphohistidine swiveling domain-containing protein
MQPELQPDDKEGKNPMMISVRTFSELTAKEKGSAGGKGGTLAHLYQASYPVPDGFVILPAGFAGDELRPEAWDQVQTQLKRMRENGTAFAVRSSALSEDSAQASFAGEFETMLDLHTDDMIREAIHAVRRSRHSERVQTYTQVKGMDGEHDMAVVVQQLVRADISGVLFTADPVSGSRTRMMGNYIYGLGDELVSGEAEPYTFTLELPKGRYDGPAALARFARKLYKMARRLEKDLGSPQDIEWCIADGKVFLLQSRPITTLLEYDPISYDWNSSYTGDYLWGETAGVYPEVLTPSTWSVWLIVFGREMSGHKFTGNIGGRYYVNYSILYSLLRRFGRRHQDIVDMLSLMMQPLPDGMEIPTVPISIWDLLASASLKELTRQRKFKRQAAEIVAAAPERCRKLEAQIQAAQDSAALIRLWHEVVRPLFWDSFLLQDAYNEGFTYPFGALKKELTELLGQAEAEALISTIGGGTEQLATVGITAGLLKVARGEMSREEYLRRYGHRHANENELSVQRPKEDPEWLDRQLAELEKHPVDIEAMLEKRAAEFDVVWAQFEGRYPKRAKSIKRKLDNLTQTTHMREAIRSELTRAIGVIRAWFLRAGEITGLADDIFFLTYEETLDLLSGDETAVACIPARRETHEKYRGLPPYPAWIRGRFDPIQWAADPNRRHDAFDAHASLASVPESSTLKGYPGSAGQVEGLVRRIDSPEASDQLQSGEILVAVTTNIGWTPLFPRAAAVVTDIGAPLAHAAIVARELGIPAVVGCGNATLRLRTGDRVRVDGTQGIVEILETA